MDISSVYGSSYSDGTSKTPADVEVQPNEEFVASVKGGKTDALSALKLDPAVLEAQVTIEKGPKMPNYVPEESLPEQSSEKESQPTLPANLSFEETLIYLQENSLLNISTEQCAYLLAYANSLRNRQIQQQKQGDQECAFCRKSGKSATHYTSHTLKDAGGRIRCPILRALKCPRCGATGDWAHTLKYCLKNYSGR